MPCRKHKGGKRFRATCQVSSYEVSDISHGDCSQHCKMLSADFSRLIVLTVYGLVPFIVSFHDLRLVLRIANPIHFTKCPCGDD